MNFFELSPHRSSRTLESNCFASDQQITDQRLPHLLLLLQELEKSVRGLERLPESELSDIIFAAIRVCGYVEPIDALQAVATVLEVLESEPTPGNVSLWAQDEKAS